MWNFYIDLELQQTGDNGILYDFFKKTDQNNISKCHENAREWFKNVMPLNEVEKNYRTPILHKTKGQLPIIRIRLPSYKGTVLTEILVSRGYEVIGLDIGYFKDCELVKTNKNIKQILKSIVEKCLRQGLLVVYTGRESIKIGPPLTITKSALIEGINVLDKTITEELIKTYQ